MEGRVLNPIIANLIGLVGIIVLGEIALGNLFLMAILAMGHNMLSEIYREVYKGDKSTSNKGTNGSDVS